MSYHEICVRRVQASKKACLCAWCAERIEVRTPCVYRRYRLHGHANNERMHPECYAALEYRVSEDADGDGIFYYEMGAQPRGRTDDNFDLPPEFGPDGARIAVMELPL